MVSTKYTPKSDVKSLNGAATFLALVLMVPLTLLRSYVMLYVYQLFIANVPGAPVLNMYHFLGLSLLSALFLPMTEQDESKEYYERASKMISDSLAKSLVIWGFAWFYWTLFVK
jgi:hypothetical protein